MHRRILNYHQRTITSSSTTTTRSGSNKDEFAPDNVTESDIADLQEEQDHLELSPFYRNKNNISNKNDTMFVTLENVKEMPLSAIEMNNDDLIVLAAMQNHLARIEVLKRHIMAVDLVDYDTATTTFEEIKDYHRWVGILSFPYTIGVGLALTAGFASYPLIFHLPTVEYFNEVYVTTTVPDAKDLETPLEVGIWSWRWMEPPIGQISFFLLCLQYARRQIMNLQSLGTIPQGSNIVMTLRARQLAQKFPRYNARILREFSFTDNVFTHKPFFSNIQIFRV